jgi:hypothetical protein
MSGVGEADDLARALNADAMLSSSVFTHAASITLTHNSTRNLPGSVPSSGACNSHPHLVI